MYIRYVDNNQVYCSLMSTTLLFNSQQLGLDVNGRRESNPFIGIRKSKSKSMSNIEQIVKNRSFY